MTQEVAGESGLRRSRRLQGEIVHVLDDENVNCDDPFPPCAHFQPPTKLPTQKSVIGRMRNLTRGGKHNMSTKNAVREVAKEVFSKYFHDTIYCHSFETIVRRVDSLWKDYKEGNRRLNEGQDDKYVKATKAYKELVSNKDRLFDMATTDPSRIKVCEEEWGVKMSDMELMYLQDQRSERKMECDKGVDPIWYRATMRQQRIREKQDQNYIRRREEQNRGKTYEEIEAIMIEQGEISSSSSSPGSTLSSPSKSTVTPQTHFQEDPAPPVPKKRRLFNKSLENDFNVDIMPIEYRHIRLSEKKVREEFYQTCANLCGQGLSVHEASNAIIEVANGMFGRQWKRAGDTEVFDLDTVPERIRIVESLKQIEVLSLNLVVEKMKEEKESGRMITLASDSTTRRGIGQFIGQGIHIGQSTAFPLPLLGISGETKEDIAAQLGMGMEILSAVSGQPVKELLSLVDTLLTDSVEHNKGVNQVLAEMYNLEKPVGQIFCGTHTVLGFSNTMNKLVMEIELNMKLETILSGFMVSIELDSKNGSLAGQALDMMLKLVAPEYKHKSWNYFGLYTNYLEQRELDLTLFSYKDHRFGCLSRAAAVLLNNFEHLAGFLSDNPHISNKLACLVRELMNLPHLRVVYCAFASIGVHLIEPFYARTITQGATHSELKVFYKNIYDCLISQKAHSEFLTFSKPFFPGVSEMLLKGVKNSYGMSVLQSVMEVAQEHEEDVLLLINHMLPQLGQTLAKQRRDYGLDQELFPPEFPVEEQASNVDDTPTNNMDMERLMGKTDYRLQKLQTLDAVSRSIILQKTQQLREAQKDTSFHSYKVQVEAKRELDVQWNKIQSQKFKEDAAMKREVALNQERKRLTLLEQLKILEGPFTNAEEVQEYLENSDVDPKVKQARMKKEVKFARDSSTTLPRVDPLFKIQVTMKNKKRRDKTAIEFGEALMAYLGKKADRSVLEYSSFQRSLRDVMVT